MEHPAVLLRRLEARARRSLGQNFLASERAVRAIAELAGAAPGARVLEVGPGLGALTGELLARGARVLAVELDADLAAFLRERYAGAALDVRVADAAALDWAALLGAEGRWTAVGNLPYNAATRILLGLLAHRARLDRLVLMFQREVAERIVAPPGDRHRGSLSAAVQARATARIALRLPPGAFHPPPKVHSAVLVLEPRAEPAWGAVPEARFDAAVRAAFSRPRATLRRALATAWGREAADRALARAGLDGRRRAATLTLDELARLAAVAP